MKSLLQLLHPNILLPDTALPVAEADHTFFYLLSFILSTSAQLCAGGKCRIFFRQNTTHTHIIGCVFVFAPAV